jgi:hypothetical protein
LTLAREGDHRGGAAWIGVDVSANGLVFLEMVDQVNARWGRGHAQEHRLPAYAIQWEDLPVAQVG